MLTVIRWRASSLFVVVTGAPTSGRYVNVRSAGESFGLATSTNVVK
jgi:hypothetical protein